MDMTKKPWPFRSSLAYFFVPTLVIMYTKMLAACIEFDNSLLKAGITLFVNVGVNACWLIQRSLPNQKHFFFT